MQGRPGPRGKAPRTAGSCGGPPVRHARRRAGRAPRRPAGRPRASARARRNAPAAGPRPPGIPGPGSWSTAPPGRPLRVEDAGHHAIEWLGLGDALQPVLHRTHLQAAGTVPTIRLAGVHGAQVGAVRQPVRDSVSDRAAAVDCPSSARADRHRRANGGHGAFNSRRLRHPSFPTAPQRHPSRSASITFHHIVFMRM